MQREGRVRRRLGRAGRVRPRLIHLPRCRPRARPRRSPPAAARTGRSSVGWSRRLGAWRWSCDVDGRGDCEDGADEERCPVNGCGQTLGDFYGWFWPPGRRAAVARDCSWVVDTGDSRHLLLQLSLQLAAGDWLRVYDGPVAEPRRLLATADRRNNGRPVTVETSGGQLAVSYHGAAGGFNATYRVKGYCLPQEQPCGDGGGCYTDPQRCDGWWHCPDGRDERGCGGCQADEYPCGGGGGGGCYPASGRCNNRKNCASGADEFNCLTCQPGNFRCASNTCVFEEWRCDGQDDCPDGSDERGCLLLLPRKVITAALIGSLVCGLLLVVALGCAFKLYSLRSRDYRAFDTPMSRLEADLVQREAPPSYGQLIAQGLIPPVDDFPTYNPAQLSVLQNLRSAMRRQMRRHSMRRAAGSGRLRRVWNRFFQRPRGWGLIPLLTPSHGPPSSRPGGADGGDSSRARTRGETDPESDTDAETDRQVGAARGGGGPGSPPEPRPGSAPKPPPRPGRSEPVTGPRRTRSRGDPEREAEGGRPEPGPRRHCPSLVRSGRARVMSLGSVRLTVYEVCYAPPPRTDTAPPPPHSPAEPPSPQPGARHKGPDLPAPEPAMLSPRGPLGHTDTDY